MNKHTLGLLLAMLWRTRKADTFEVASSHAAYIQGMIAVLRIEGHISAVEAINLDRLTREALRYSEGWIK